MLVLRLGVIEVIRECTARNGAPKRQDVRYDNVRLIG